MWLGGPSASLTPGWGWILGELLQNPQVLLIWWVPHSVASVSLDYSRWERTAGGRRALLRAQEHVLFHLCLLYVFHSAAYFKMT